ncbi:MAG: hypothetical protein WC428_06760 [Candidatus Paceibacterota bacterium]
MTDQTKAIQTEVKSSEIQLVAREIAQRLKYMIVNGNKLSDNEVYSLAQYSAANGLNPFAGECYYLPGVGPCPGVAGWRTKAQDQLDFEAKLANQAGGNMWCEYFHADPADCVFDPEKDIAYKVVLHDSVSRKRWTDSIKEIALDFVNAGVPFFDAFDKSKELIGAEPVTVSWGVVYGSENFAREGKTEKFDRHERAKKRGEKLCLRKRFPRIHLPEPDNFDDSEMVESTDFHYVMDESEEKPTRSVEQNITELGFEPEPKQPSILPESQPVTTEEKVTNDETYDCMNAKVIELFAASWNMSKVDAAKEVSGMKSAGKIIGKLTLEQYQKLADGVE